MSPQRRDILAYLVLEMKKYVNEDSASSGLLTSMAARQHFPHMTEQQLDYAVALLQRGMRVASEEQVALDQQQAAPEQ